MLVVTLEELSQMFVRYRTFDPVDLVFDYLAEEVLERQPGGQVREFLLETSIAEHLTGTLCDAITGHSDGQEMLERLERENLFVIALDDERRWYRYHHLFADLLRLKLKHTQPALARELRRILLLTRLRQAPWWPLPTRYRASLPLVVVLPLVPVTPTSTPQVMM